MATASEVIDQLDALRHDLGVVAGWLADNADDLAGVYVHVGSNGARLQASNAEQFAYLARLLSRGAPLGSVEKDYLDDIARVGRKFGAAEVLAYTYRADVCERVQVGTETIEVPDPDAPLVTVEQPVYEWQCGSILEGSVA